MRPPTHVRYAVFNQMSSLCNGNVAVELSNVER